jgi:hypothetical protein
MPRSVNLGSILIASFGAALLLEAWWAGVASQWFAAARFWAALHPQAALRGLAGSAVGFIVLAWGLRKGYRWAWLAAMTWTIAWAGLVTAVLIIFLFGGTAKSQSLAVSFARSHPLALLAGAVSAGALYGGLLCLARKDARAYFIVRP